MYIDDIEAAIRKSIAEESEAISLYLDRIIKLEEVKTWAPVEYISKIDILIKNIHDIMEEEKVHVGQLDEMLDLFDISREKEDEGEKEAKEIASESFISVAKKLKKYV
jgi:hypothetical protein